MISKLLETLSFPIYESIVYILFPGIIILYIFNWWFAEIIVASKYRSKGHSWRSIQLSKSIPYNVLCSVCERLMLSAVGHYCERCAMSACRGCRRSANKKTSCRVTTAPHSQPFTHNWVKVGAACDECGVGITEDRGCDYFCCWCQRIQHCASGLPSEVEVCDFGEYRSMILPPTSVTVDRKGVISIQPPDWPDWQPLIVIGNPKSGGQSGDEVLSFFRGYLNPLQVVRLGRAGLATALRWIPANSRVLIAGGDGSVAAVLTAITDAGIKPAPPVGILPLGTGNDLSRVLGWGGACPVPLSPRSLFDDIKQAIPETIDRWSVRVGRRQLFAYNYVSVGVDARVALDFHRARRHPLYLCGSQTINYLIYLFLGTQQAVSQDCLGLEKILELKLDGVDIPLPSLQALLLLNIPSWGAGVDVWNGGADTTVAPQSINDGQFEVLGITSSFHIAQLSIGLSQPMRLGQGSTATIKMKGKAPMQVDGEPWEQGPCEIILEKAGSAVVLSRNSTVTVS